MSLLKKVGSIALTVGTGAVYIVGAVASGVVKSVLKTSGEFESNKSRYQNYDDKRLNDIANNSNDLTKKAAAMSVLKDKQNSDGRS